MDQQFIKQMIEDIGEEAANQILKEYLVTVIGRLSDEDTRGFCDKIIEEPEKK